MKMKWKQSLVMCTVVASLLIPSASLHVIAGESSVVKSSTDNNYLTSSIKEEVKSILNEQTPNGTRVGAVVRLYNEGAGVIRVPEYEVRVRTEEGVEYILRPSVANMTRIQPKETVELSYMIVVDRYDVFSLKELSWVEVDEFVYPKLEKRIKSIPISAIEWKGENSVLSNPGGTKQWGEAFTIPVLSTSLEYKPISIREQSTSEGPMSIIGLLAVNKSDVNKTIPDFRIDGKSDKKMFKGKRLEQEVLTLEPNEQRYIHYAIPAGSELNRLTILTPESFAADASTNINYAVGRLNVSLPGDETTALSYMNQLPAYVWSKPIQFDSLSKLIQPEVDISMEALHINESAGGGYKAAVAKFKLQNRSDQPIPVPKFQAGLMSVSGKKYLGVRQNTQVETLIPNISYVIYYSFILPSTETGARLAMEILDGQLVAPYNIPIAAFQTQVQPTKLNDNKLLDFYPYKANLSDWKVGRSYNPASSQPYSIKLNLDWSIEIEDELVVDQNFSRLKIETTDANGKVMGSKFLSLTGENRLTSGVQTLSFDSTQLETTLILQIYESIDTPFGEVKRLLQTLR
ncbi:hypothetical protein D3C73_567800 [compost metagenome]